MKQANCIACNNQTCLFKNSLLEECLKSFYYDAKQFIFKEDMSVKGLYIVEYGAVEEFYFDLNNEKIIKNTIKQGEVFGHVDYGGTKHLLNAVAIENTKICFFDKNYLSKACQTNSEWAIKVMNFFLEQLNKPYDKKAKWIV